MAKSTDKKNQRSLRQSISDDAKAKPKKRRLKGGVNKAGASTKSFIGKGSKEYYLPMPDNKAGRFLGKKRSIIPKYFKESWAELKMVTWPDRKTTVKLTIAVLTFAIVFGLAIAVIDYGLDKIFRYLILEN